MPLLARIAKTTLVSGAAGLGTFLFLTRKNDFVPMDPSTSPLFRKKYIQSWNRNQNPTTHDDCMRKVPLDQIRPELLGKEGELVRAFSAGIWSGPGYTLQRSILHRKYYGDRTKDQLWTPEQLKQSNYEVGAVHTDHFEVIERTPNSIVFRCGDSPHNDNREMDGVFELAAEVKREEGVAEFHLRTVGWVGAAKSDKPPMDPVVQWLHQQYDKLWMETGLWNVKK
ncbi:hypothetical protein V5O48_005561 [Marasmius crinis-equi]|uniref:Uncharacterized protein n=1 Tax=Marasmius crinis-equi TaxID=585013 RepID=A0ABR3FLY1_9AGAR